jgi:(S)-ureidoglycine aminohydrolase
MTDYYTPTGGLPPQTDLLTGRAVFTDAYAVIPKGTLRDITTSLLPGWDKMRMWVIARPLSGFAETFSHYITEVAPGGGSKSPETDEGAQAVLFVVSGHAELTIGDQTHLLFPGSYAYLSAGCDWTFANDHDAPCTFHWIRKTYVPAPGLPAPEAFVTQVSDAPTIEMEGTNGAWSTTRFVSPTSIS